MIDEKAWNDFQVTCEVYKNKIDNIEKRVYNHDERITVIEKENTKTDLQYTQIMEKLNKLIDTTIPALSAEIQAIKNKPVERYNKAVISIITTTIGGIIGYVLSKLFT